MDQSTANRIALIKVITPALVALLFGMAIVLLAWFHDGAYGQIIVSQFPAIMIACLGTLGVLRITDVIGSVLQTKYTGAPNTVPPSGPEVSAPPVNSTNGTHTNGALANGTPASSAAPPAAVVDVAADPAAGA